MEFLIELAIILLGGAAAGAVLKDIAITRPNIVRFMILALPFVVIRVAGFIGSGFVLVASGIYGIIYFTAYMLGIYLGRKILEEFNRRR